LIWVSEPYNCFCNLKFDTTIWLTLQAFLKGSGTRISHQQYYFEIRKSLYQSNFILSLISAFSAPNSSSRAFLHSQLVQIFLLTTIMNLNFCISLNKSSSHHQASIQLVRQFVLFDHHIIMLLCNIFGVYCCCFGFLISLNLLKFSSNFNLCS